MLNNNNNKKTTDVAKPYTFHSHPRWPTTLSPREGDSNPKQMLLRLPVRGKRSFWKWVRNHQVNESHSHRSYINYSTTTNAGCYLHIRRHCFWKIRGNSYILLLGKFELRQLRCKIMLIIRQSFETPTTPLLRTTTTTTTVGYPGQTGGFPPLVSLALVPGSKGKHLFSQLR